MSDSESSYDSDSSVSSFEQPMTGGSKNKKSVKKTTKTQPKTSSKKTVKKSDKSEDTKKSSKKATKKASEKAPKKSSKKTTKKKSKGENSDDKSKDKPKRQLNPIMKQMNVLRNEHIGKHLGTKAPMKTIPPFKLVLAEARTSMKMGEKDKNTVEVVDKAIEMFNANPEKYCK